MALGVHLTRSARHDRRSAAFAFPLLVLCAMSLAGCESAGSAPPGIAPSVFTVVVAVWKLRNMTADRLLRETGKGNFFTDHVTEVGNHVKFFLRLRAEVHLQTQSNTDTVAAAVAAEYDLMRAFVGTNIGLDSNSPAALITGADGTPHLDFKDVLRVKVAAGPIDDSRRLTHELKRWHRAMKIVWRAGALERDLWIPSFSADALKEILDRRLRITERMLYQISAEVSGTLQPSSALPQGPWPDGVRVRMFEYPLIPASLESSVGAAQIGPAAIWQLDFAKENLNYNGFHRIRTAAATQFVPAVGTTFVDKYPHDLVPGGSPATAIDNLFQQSADWWDRSWIYCDQVLAAIHLESLRFGKRRRTGSDTLFNDAVNSHPRGWAQLRPLLPNAPGETRLMGDDATRPPTERLFANGPIPQVQLGDHVVFWNSIMYGLLSDGAWSLENAVVVDLQSDWSSNDIADSTRLMGHGTDETFAGRFREELKRALDKMLAAARNKAKAATTDSTPWLRAAAPLVRWAPFNEPWVDETGVARAPWWIRVPFADTPPDWVGRALGRDATLFTLPDCVEYNAAPGLFGSAPPAAGGGPANAVYFPLWCPAQGGKWKGYLDRRRAGHVPTTFKLEPVKFDAGNIPGLILPREFVPGAAKPQVHTVRPIVAR